MGWFSGSSASTTATAVSGEAPQQQDTQPSSAPSSSSPTSVAVLQPDVAVSSAPIPVPATPVPATIEAAQAVAANTAIGLLTQEQDTDRLAEQSQAQTRAYSPVHTPAPMPADVLELDEYKTPDDGFYRFRVSDAWNQLAACSSLGATVRNYYRYGKYKDCSDRYDHLKFCLSLKTKSSQVAQVMIQKRDAELRAKKKGQPSSEDVWTVRT
ncbi:hypothetical protein EDD11_010403 [Mortierella claussenii]|nr:hypothetical protein EDD11_010403 [Mortierella claussenii]